MKINNILVPIDFSDCSKNALRFAIHLAKLFDAKIHMVNAVHVQTSHPNLAGSNLMASVIADYETQVKESFEELEREIIELKNVPYEADRFVTYLIDAIYTETINKKIDLIVMGTKAKHTGLEELLGSRASDVIESATVPIMIIPELWTFREVNKIGFAFETDEIKNPKRLRLLNKIAVGLGAQVLGFTIRENASSQPLKEQKLFQEFVRHFDEGTASMRSVEAESVLKGIKDFSANQQLDMIALIPKEHNFLERIFKKSISKNLVIETHIPLLAFRE